VIEIHVSAGDEIAPEDPLVTLESDKATMDVPAPFAGVVKQLRVSIGDRVSEGSVLLVVERDGAQPSGESNHLRRASADGKRDTEVLVIGAGPGGYTAAFRAADLGLKTTLVERYDTLGGVCLNVGCIPSKALLHAARVVTEAEEMGERGLKFGKPKLDLETLLAWKQGAVKRLTDGLAGLARQRKVEVITGEASFNGPSSVQVGGDEVWFENCIIAAGSRAAMLADLPEDERIIDSTSALSPKQIARRLLVIGGGIIGLEMAMVYDALGSRVTVVELLDQLIPGCDQDLVKPLQQRISQRYEAVRLQVSVEAIKAQKSGLKVTFSDGESEQFDQVLVAIGRKSNADRIGADRAGIDVDGSGFIRADERMRTNVEGIYAIGDVAGEPLLAHKAAHQGKVAAEAISGDEAAVFDARAIPAVAYTDPEVAWTGLTETQAREAGVEYEKAVFPWAASGRALTVGRDDGLTKLLVEPGSGRVLGAGIVGVGAGELIAEAVQALEFGADAEDIALAIHPHPTLSETVGFAAEMAAGTITDLMPPRRPARR
jgi:dihydrolipoamide dehydrogenase